MPLDRKIWTENWVENKAGQTVSLQLIWRTVLEPLDRIHLSHLNPILRAIGQPSSARILFSSMLRCKDPNFVIEQFYERVDHYSLSLKDWLNAIETFLAWNESKNKKPSFNAAVDYISCCADWLESKPDSGSLNDVTQEMLDKFGWDGNDSACKTR